MTDAKAGGGDITELSECRAATAFRTARVENDKSFEQNNKRD